MFNNISFMSNKGLHLKQTVNNLVSQTKEISQDALIDVEDREKMDYVEEQLTQIGKNIFAAKLLPFKLGAEYNKSVDTIFNLIDKVKERDSSQDNIYVKQASEEEKYDRINIPMFAEDNPVVIKFKTKDKTIEFDLLRDYKVRSRQSLTVSYIAASDLPAIKQYLLDLGERIKDPINVAKNFKD